MNSWFVWIVLLPVLHIVRIAIDTLHACMCRSVTRVEYKWSGMIAYDVWLLRRQVFRAKIEFVVVCKE
jgi:hypothetical protein